MKISTLDKHMHLIPEVVSLHNEIWPAFVNANPTPHAELFLTELAAFQLVALENDALVAVGNTIPIVWNEGDDMPDGWTGVIQMGVDSHRENKAPTSLCALAIGIRQTHLGKGISSKMVEGMKSLGRANRFTHLLAPVRPTLKSVYPLIPMDDYIHWQREDGSHFDPWMRVHDRLSGEMVGVAAAALTITGTVEQWQAWSGQSMQSSGAYIVKGALKPVEINIEKDSGVYVEDNVWYKYAL